MPTIFCSAKLSKLIQLKKRLPSISMNNWNAHLFFLERRKCMVFVHKETLYSFAILDVLKRDFNHFQQLFIDNYLLQLDKDRLLTMAIRSAVSNEFQHFELSITDGDKSSIGFLNNCVSRLTWPVNNKPTQISDTKKYLENYYNSYPISNRLYKSGRESMFDFLKNYNTTF
ncbi:MAG: DUF6933 domain-containing protein [Ginsengibacter sp.]